MVGGQCLTDYDNDISYSKPAGNYVANIPDLEPWPAFDGTLEEAQKAKFA